MKPQKVEIELEAKVDTKRQPMQVGRVGGSTPVDVVSAPARIKIPVYARPPPAAGGAPAPILPGVKVSVPPPLSETIASPGIQPRGRRQPRIGIQKKWESPPPRELPASLPSHGSSAAPPGSAPAPPAETAPPRSGSTWTTPVPSGEPALQAPAPTPGVPPPSAPVPTVSQISFETTVPTSPEAVTVEPVAALEPAGEKKSRRGGLGLVLAGGGAVAGFVAAGPVGAVVGGVVGYVLGGRK